MRQGYEAEEVIKVVSMLLCIFDGEHLRGIVQYTSMAFGGWLLSCRWCAGIDHGGIHLYNVV